MVARISQLLRPFPQWSLPLIRYGLPVLVLACMVPVSVPLAIGFGAVVLAQWVA